VGCRRAGGAGSPCNYLPMKNHANSFSKQQRRRRITPKRLRDNRMAVPDEAPTPPRNARNDNYLFELERVIVLVAVTAKHRSPQSRLDEE
jgi:hypothetical protein